MSNILTRVLVALVGIPLFVWITLQGGWIFTLLVALLSTLGVREFYLLSQKTGAHPQFFAGCLTAFIVPLCLHYDLSQGHHYTLAVALTAMLLILSAELWRRQPHALVNVSVSLAALSYVTLLISSLIFIRNIELSPSSPLSALFNAHDNWQAFLLLCTFICVWSGDSAAYFVGLAIGKHKIFPRVSPKKSWEGSFAGFVFSPFAFALSAHYLLSEMPVGDAIILGSLIGVVGPVGDFAESLLKRDASTKDSSELIPGHGGVLDRFDSMLFVSPLVYIYFLLMF